VDLLKYSGVKDHADRYVTSVMNLLRQPEELLAIQTADVPKMNGIFYSKVIIVLD
jgi:hypothetical protein